MNLKNKDIQTIAVFRALQLGDLLCAVPAFRALRAAFPEAHIALIGLPWAASFVNRFQLYFDEFIHFPGAEGLPEQAYTESESALFKEKMKERSFDLLLQMQGNGTIVNKLIQSWQPRILAGFENEDSRMHSPYFIDYPNYDSEVLRHLKLMQHLGITLQGDELEFPINEKDENEYRSLSVQQERFVVIHAGSRGSWRQWPISYFAECANYCFIKGFAIVVTGTENEREITTELIKRIHAPVINLTGKTSLGAMAVLLQHASLLISNCTGVSHLAAATRTPSIVISMDGEPERWGPLNKQLHYTINWLQKPDFEAVFSTLKLKLDAHKITA